MIEWLLNTWLGITVHLILSVIIGGGFGWMLTDWLENKMS